MEESRRSYLTSDIEALNQNLERVAKALERLEGGESADAEPSS